MTAQDKIDEVRNKLDSADETHDYRIAIGDILIAISQLTDVVETLVKSNTDGK